MAYKILTITIGHTSYPAPNYIQSICYNTDHLDKDFASIKTGYNFINQQLTYPYDLTFAEFKNLLKSDTDFDTFHRYIKTIEDANTNHILFYDHTKKPASLNNYLMISFRELKFFVNKRKKNIPCLIKF